MLIAIGACRKKSEMNRAERRRQRKLAGKEATLKLPYPELQYNRGNALHDRGDIEGAIAKYRSALALKPDFAQAHYNLGIALKDGGKLKDAAAHFQKAAALLPNSAEAQNNLGTVLVNTGKPDEAVAAYRKALAIRGDCAETRFNLGVALEELGRLEEATASYREAVALRPDYAEAHQNLMNLFEVTNRSGDLREAVAAAKQNCSGNPRIGLGEALLLKRNGDYAAARAILEAASKPPDDPAFLAARAYLLGELCDRLGDTEAAYRYFREGGLRRRDTPGARRVDGTRYLYRIGVLARRFTADWIAEWSYPESNDDRRDPVFLVGFPRSGTTLLDTVLRSHAAITVVEEKPALHSMRTVLARLPGGDPDGLANLDPDHLAELRRAYFAKIDEFLEPGDRSGIVIDKLPLNIVEAGLIHRVFPKSRFLFVLRHPCDCVLSCFMQNFKLNDAMANFLDLEDAARLYDKVMTLWQQYQTVLPLTVHTVPYESIVEAFDETVSPILGFLDVGWDDGIRNYAATAGARARINTPSYNQVTQPLYTQARGRWERYREHMQPVLPDLLQWARQFGYGD